jgi:hypothetical protein
MKTKNARRRAALTLAIAAGLLGGAHDARAVAVSANGLGQVLLYPYYTVNRGNQTLLSVVNTTNRVKAVRIRFHEARNGRDVLNFNIYLSAYDTWVASVYADMQSSVEPARLITTDQSCAVPSVTTSAFPTGVPFRNYQYTGANQDFPSSMTSSMGSLARTREGFVEIIEMGELQTGAGPLQLAEEATPVASTGVPANCAAFLAASLPPTSPPGFANNWSVNGAQNIDLPRGGIHGSWSIVNVAQGVMFSGPAHALTQFYTDASAPGALHWITGNVKPELSDASNGNGVARAETVLADGTRVAEQFALPTGGIDAVSLAMMQTRVMNEFVIEPALGAATEWVMTYPTKSFYVNPALSQPARLPFTDVFRDDGKARASLFTSVRDRVGRENVSPQGDCCGGICGVPPPCREGPQANNSANVMVFVANESERPQVTPILGAVVNEVADTIVTGTWFPVAAPQSGWASLSNGDPQNPGTENDNILVGPTTGNRYLGLPLIGFSVSRFVNGFVQPGVLANYSGAVPHRGELELMPNPQ